MLSDYPSHLPLELVNYLTKYLDDHESVMLPAKSQCCRLIISRFFVMFVCAIMNKNDGDRGLGEMPSKAWKSSDRMWRGWLRNKNKKKKEEKTWMSSNLKAIKFGWVSHSGVEAAARGGKTPQTG